MIIINVGLLFGLLAPTPVSHIDTCMRLEWRIEAIHEQAREAQVQLEERLQSEDFQEQVQERKRVLLEQIDALLADEARLEEALQNEELPDDIVAMLQEARNNPDVIEEFLEERAEQLPDRLRQQIDDRRDELLRESTLLFKQKCQDSDRIGISIESRSAF